MLWESIQNKITRKIIIFVLGGCKARGIPKGGFGRVLARKAKKGEKFSSATSTGLSTEKNHRNEKQIISDEKKLSQKKKFAVSIGLRE